MPHHPGVGFSGPTHETGWDFRRVARAVAALMELLGYDRYGAHGGDWGAAVSRELAMFDADHLAGIHINMVTAPPDPETMNDLSEREKDALADMTHFQEWESGYSKEQSTRPQTVGYGLVDSPAGLCAWIVEMFFAGTDSDGDPANVLTRDEMLDNVMLYWVPGTGASSARLYWQSFRDFNGDPITVPTGCSIFPKEIFRPSRRWAEKRFTDLRYWNELDKGGHFAAFEQPETFVNELRACFRPLR